MAVEYESVTHKKWILTLVGQKYLYKSCDSCSVQRIELRTWNISILHVAAGGVCQRRFHRHFACTNNFCAQARLAMRRASTAAEKKHSSNELVKTKEAFVLRISYLVHEFEIPLELVGNFANRASAATDTVHTAV